MTQSGNQPPPADPRITPASPVGPTPQVSTSTNQASQSPSPLQSTAMPSSRRQQAWPSNFRQNLTVIGKWFTENRHRWIVGFLLACVLWLVLHRLHVPGFETAFGLPVSRFTTFVTPISLLAVCLFAAYYQAYLGDFFLWCTGAKLDAINRACTDRIKYICFGATILLTACFAWLSGSYAFYTVFKEVNVAIGLGLIWALAVFNLDRSIVSTMRRQHPLPTDLNTLSLWRWLQLRIPWSELTLAVPRILVAVVIAFTVAKPLELKLLEGRIDRRIRENRSAEVEEQILPQIRRINQEIPNLQAQLKQQQDQIDAKNHAVYVERTGHGLSNRFGYGPESERLDKEAKQLEASLKSSMDGLRKQITDDQRHRTELDEQMKTLLTSIHTPSGLEKENDFVDRITALDDLTEGRRKHPAFVEAPVNPEEERRSAAIEALKDEDAKKQGLTISRVARSISSIIFIIELAPLLLKLVNAFSIQRPYEDSLDELDSIDAEQRQYRVEARSQQREQYNIIQAAETMLSTEHHQLEQSLRRAEWLPLEQERQAAELERTRRAVEHAEAMAPVRDRELQLEQQNQNLAYQREQIRQEHDYRVNILHKMLDNEMEHEIEAKKLIAEARWEQWQLQQTAKYVLQTNVRKELDEAVAEQQVLVGKERIRLWGKAQMQEQPPPAFRNPRGSTRSGGSTTGAVPPPNVTNSSHSLSFALPQQW